MRKSDSFRTPVVNNLSAFSNDIPGENINGRHCPPPVPISVPGSGVDAVTQTEEDVLEKLFVRESNLAETSFSDEENSMSELPAITLSNEKDNPIVIENTLSSSLLEPFESDDSQGSCTESSTDSEPDEESAETNSTLDPHRAPTSSGDNASTISVKPVSAEADHSEDSPQAPDVDTEPLSPQGSFQQNTVSGKTTTPETNLSDDCLRSGVQHPNDNKDSGKESPPAKPKKKPVPKKNKKHNPSRRILTRAVKVERTNVSDETNSVEMSAQPKKFTSGGKISSVKSQMQLQQAKLDEAKNKKEINRLKAELTSKDRILTQVLSDITDLNSSTEEVSEVTLAPALHQRLEKYRETKNELSQAMGEYSSLRDEVSTMKNTIKKLHTPSEQVCQESDTTYLANTISNLQSELQLKTDMLRECNTELNKLRGDVQTLQGSLGYRLSLINVNVVDKLRNSVESAEMTEELYRVSGWTLLAMGMRYSRILDSAVEVIREDRSLFGSTASLRRSQKAVEILEHRCTVLMNSQRSERCRLKNISNRNWDRVLYYARSVVTPKAPQQLPQRTPSVASHVRPSSAPATRNPFSRTPDTLHRAPHTPQPTHYPIVPILHKDDTKGTGAAGYSPNPPPLNSRPSRYVFLFFLKAKKIKWSKVKVAMELILLLRCVGGGF